MKRILFSLTIILLITVTAHTQQTDTKIYNQQRLNIEIQQGFFGSTIGAGAVVGGTVRTWTPYHGFEKVTEPEFFNIAGYSREAELAKKYHNASKALLISGIAVFVGGMGTSIAGMVMMSGNEDPYNHTPENIAGAGLLTMTGGAVPLLWGLARKNWATADQAISVMQDYNSSVR